MSIPTTGFLQGRSSVILAVWLSLCQKGSDHRSGSCETQGEAILVRTQGNISPGFRVKMPANLEIWTMDKEDISAPRETHGKFNFTPSVCPVDLPKGFTLLAWVENGLCTLNMWIHIEISLQSTTVTPRNMLFHPLKLTSYHSSVTRAWRRNSLAALWFHNAEGTPGENPNDFVSFFLQATRLSSAQGHQAI